MNKIGVLLSLFFAISLMVWEVAQVMVYFNLREQIDALSKRTGPSAGTPSIESEAELKSRHFLGNAFPAQPIRPTLSKCQWAADDGVRDGWLENFICGDRVIGAVRNKQNATGMSSDSKFWLAEKPIGWILGTYTNKKSAKERVQRSELNETSTRVE